MSDAKKYLIRFREAPFGGVSAAWEQLKDEPDEIFTERRRKFEGASVAIVCSRPNEITMARAIARVLHPVASEVKLIKTDKPAALTDQQLADAPCVRAAVEAMSDEEFASIAGVSSWQVIHPAQDYRAGVLYYGCTIEGYDKLVTSDGHYIPLSAAENNDIRLLHPEVSISGLHAEVVGEFIDGATEPKADDICNRIRGYIERYIVFPVPEAYDVLAVWIMGTYIFRGFRYYPYLHINAEKGSGKTLLMELMAPVSFNGMLLSQPAASTVIKLIHQNSATLFIDEAEALGHRPSGAPSQIKQILKTGFARSGVFYIGDRMHRTYSPKCFAGISDLDDVLADRAITIKMLRKRADEHKELYRETADVLQEQQELRDQLYLFGLCHGPKIIADYDAKKPAYDRLVHLTNRAYDVWVPLYRITSAFANEETKGRIFNSLDKCSQLDGKRRVSRDAEENETGALIQGLSEIIPYVPPIAAEAGINYYDPDALHAAMVKGEKIPKSVSKKGFSRLIKRTLEIESVPRAYGLGTKRMYAFDPVKFEDYKARYADLAEKIR